MQDTHYTRIKQHAAVVDVTNLRAAAAVHLTSHEFPVTRVGEHSELLPPAHGH
jgi:hypothetical protein